MEGRRDIGRHFSRLIDGVKKVCITSSLQLNNVKVNAQIKSSNI